MIENKFPVTVEDLNETSSRILWYTPRYRKTMIVMPIVIIVMMVILRLIQPDASILLMVVLALVLLYYLYSSSRKVPRRMSAQLYQDMKKKVRNRRSTHWSMRAVCWWLVWTTTATRRIPFPPSGGFFLQSTLSWP